MLQTQSSEKHRQRAQHLQRHWQFCLLCLLIFSSLFVPSVSYAKILNPFQQKNIFVCVAFSDFLAKERFQKLIGQTSYFVRTLEYHGLFSTAQSVVTVANQVRKGQNFHFMDFQKSLEKYHELGVFEDVNTCFDINEVSHEMDITYNFSEHWTLIPYAGLGAGGGSLTFTVGMIDSNFLKIASHFAYNFNCKNEFCSSTVGFQNPHFLQDKATLGLDIKKLTRYYALYNNHQEIKGNFVDSADVFGLTFLWKFTTHIAMGGGVEYRNAQTSSQLLNAKQKRHNLKFQYNLPPDSQAVGVKAILGLGKIKKSRLKSRGLYVKSQFVFYPVFANSEKQNYFDFHFLSKFYTDKIPFSQIYFPNESTFNLRLGYLYSGSLLDSNKHFMGGLDRVRGFLDNAFAGRHLVFTNFEFRINALVTKFGALQNAFFYDQGFAADSFDKMFSTYDRPTSLGLGVRLIPFIVNNVAVRIDYGFGLAPYFHHGLSFGFAQFF